MRKGLVLQLDDSMIISKEVYEELYEVLLKQYNNNIVLLPNNVHLIKTYDIGSNDKPIQLINNNQEPYKVYCNTTEQNNWVK